MKDLHKLGYAQQLFREMGGFSNFAISFSIISILTGAIILFGYGLKFAGPIINTVGWPLVSLFTFAVVASMAELASAYPTAGGLYYWAYRLGGKAWAWVTAWLNMLGQITITAGINMAAAIYITGLFVGLFNIPGDATVPILGAVNGWNFWLFVMAIVTIPQVLINVRVQRGYDWQKKPAVLKAKQTAEKSLGGNGRVLLRASGTESVLRVMVEGKDETKVRALAKNLAAAVESAR